jgi:REP element-mobilizing transposase RayT
MATPRKEVVTDGQTGVYHCISRCVRRAFLCGFDKYLNRSFEHRKEWIKERLQLLVSNFAVDLCSYALMSGHLHLILRTAPDQVDDWTDEDVARRWLTIFPMSGHKSHDPDKISATEFQMLVMNKKRIKEIRERLSSVSWFMRCLNEYIARLANKEDDCKGRFWEGRFKCIKLLDDSAVLACMAYVDLNPIRAGIAKTPEDSEFTGIYDRIIARGMHTEAASLQPPPDSWLCPITTDGTTKPDSILNMELDDYLRLVDWSGRQIREDKRGAIPVDLAPILERLKVDPDHWLRTVTGFEGFFFRVAGRLKSMTEAARQAGVRWLRGCRASRQAFANEKF